MPVAKLKCKKCGKYEYREKIIKTPYGKFCTKDHAYCFAQDKLAKDNKKKLAKLNQVLVKKEKSVKIDLAKRKEAIKPASKFLSEAQTAFNKYIRIRDYLDACISCGRSREEIENEQGWKVGGCWDSGHFMTRGAKGQLRFVLFNANKQCKKCNGGSDKFSHKAATVGEKYRITLIEKIGIKKVEWLENNNDIDLRKKDIEYLKRIKIIFNKRARFYRKRVGA